MIAGAIAQYAAAPLRIPYLVYLVLLGLAVIAGAVSPETVKRSCEPYPYRPQRIRLVHGDLSRYLAAAAGAFAAFAMAWLPLWRQDSSRAPCTTRAACSRERSSSPSSMPPQWLRRGMPGWRPAAGSPSACSPKPREWRRSRWGVEVTSLAVFLIGGAVAGIGAGVLFKSAIGQTAVLAFAQGGEALAGLFLVFYTGLIVPVLGVGIATQYVSATTAMLAFTAVLLGVLLLVAVVGPRSGRSRPADSAPRAV